VAPAANLSRRPISSWTVGGQSCGLAVNTPRRAATPGLHAVSSLS